MDGSPSAPISDPEQSERATPSRRSDIERELDELRARAYGPKPDIDTDPSAIARLIELEAAHVGAATPPFITEPAGSRAADDWPTVPPTDENVDVSPAAADSAPTIPTTSRRGSARWLWQRATLTRSREWFVVGSIVLAAILGSTVWLLAPHPDASLQPTEAGPETEFIGTMIAQDENPDLSTLRQFERYHDIDVWSVQVSSVENSSGNTCLIAWDRVGGRFQYECLATGIELAVHMTVVAEAEDSFGEWLPDGSIVSLHLRDDRVDVFVRPPPATT